jgi:hypothetical protein
VEKLSKHHISGMYQQTGKSQDKYIYRLIA